MRFYAFLPCYHIVKLANMKIGIAISKKGKTKLDNKKDKKHQKDNLNFNYKKLSEDEILLDNLLNTREKDIPKSEIVDEMIKGNILDVVKNQANMNKRDDLQEIVHKDNAYSTDYKNVAKTIPWFAEYKKQTITITKEKIRAYLRNYKDLGRLIKYRKQKIKNGKIKPESQELNLNNFENYDFLEESVIDKQTFLTSTDYKIQEMEFYQKELMIILKYLKKYIFVSYQFLVLKYYLKLPDKDLKIATNIEKTEYIDNVIIEYIYQKLCEEAKNNGRNKDNL